MQFSKPRPEILPARPKNFTSVYWIVNIEFYILIYTILFLKLFRLKRRKQFSKIHWQNFASGPNNISSISEYDKKNSFLRKKIRRNVTVDR